MSRADKSVTKLEKDITELDDAICYACQQPLGEDKKQEILSKKQKEFDDSLAYQKEVSDKLTSAYHSLQRGQ